MNPHILLTNDDGISSHGLAVLRNAVDGLGEITTIAPATNTSGVARSITISRPLSLNRAVFGGGWEGIACNGTPSDCVRVGFLGTEAPLPALVLSGINLGSNMGSDVSYSGTVGAALEAALRGCPAVAFSVASRHPQWLEEAAAVVRRVTEAVLTRGLPPSTVLNVNLPDAPLEGVAGVRPARLGGASIHDRVFLQGDGDGRVPLAHPTPEGQALAVDGAVDFDVVEQGYVALTPLRHDLLDSAFLQDLSLWDLDQETQRA